MSSAEVWADVIASGALAVSVYAAVQSRKSVKAAQDSADHAARAADAAEDSATSSGKLTEIEASRHYEERRPKWNVELERRKRGQTGPRRLVLELLSPEDVDEAVVQSTDGRITFREAQEGVDFAGDRAETVRRVEPGRPVMWEVETPQPPRGGTARIKLGCMVDGQSWGYFFDVKLPSAPRQSVVMG